MSETEQVTSSLSCVYSDKETVKSADITREIYLVFCNQSDTTRFKIARFLKKGFRHVFAIERQNFGWICVDASERDLMTIILPAYSHNDVIAQLKHDNKDFTILQLAVPIFSKRKFPKIALLSCVSVMQYYLGLFSQFVFTPHQLYHHVKKQHWFVREI